MSYLASQDSISWYVQGAPALASRYADRSLVRSAPWQVMVLAGEVFVTGSLSHALEPNAPTKQVVGFSIIFCGMVRVRGSISRGICQPWLTSCVCVCVCVCPQQAALVVALAIKRVRGEVRIEYDEVE